MTLLLLSDVMQRVFVVCYKRFGTTYRSRLHGFIRPRPFKIGPLGFPETSITNNQTKPPNILQELGSGWLVGWLVNLLLVS
jgi:hypothetical protein